MTTAMKSNFIDRLCEEPGCVQPSVAIYKKRNICGLHLNPEIPKKDASEVVLVRSNWLPFDEEDPIRPGEAYDAKRAQQRKRARR
jgi:hypothetical protein